MEQPNFRVRLELTPILAQPNGVQVVCRASDLRAMPSMRQQGTVWTIYPHPRLPLALNVAEAIQQEWPDAIPQQLGHGVRAWDHFGVPSAQLPCIPVGWQHDDLAVDLFLLRVVVILPDVVTTMLPWDRYRRYAIAPWNEQEGESELLRRFRRSAYTDLCWVLDAAERNQTLRAYLADRLPALQAARDGSLLLVAGCDESTAAGIDMRSLVPQPALFEVEG